MRIAVCLSGYLRCYKFLEENFKLLFLRELRKLGSVDIFISTWDKLNSKSCCSVHRNTVPEVQYGDFDFYDVHRAYEPVDCVIGSYEEIKQKFLISNFVKDVGLKTLLPDIHDDGVLYGLAQYYHRKAVNDLKQNYEAESGFKYDIVIAMRPDLIFLKPFSLQNFDPEKLYLRTFYNDAFLVSSSLWDDKISNLFHNVRGIAEKYGQTKFEWFEPFAPEYWLENHYKDIGLGMDKRVELGEDTFWYFPKKDFLALCNHIYQKTGNPEGIQYLLDYFRRHNTPYF